MGSGKNDMGDCASPGKFFIGGLAKENTLEQFVNYFGTYGEITDSIILKDRQSGRPRGFGFVTYIDPSVVDIVIAKIHVINGKQAEIKRTTPRGSSAPKVVKTKKIFVGGIPTSVTEDELESFFSKFGKVVEHQIIRDRITKHSRGFGFIVFESDQVVDDLLVNGNMIDMVGTKVEIKKAEPKKPSNSAPSSYVFPYSNTRAGFGSFPNSNSSLGPFPYDRPISGRFGEFDGGYRGYRGSDHVGYCGEPFVGNFNQLGNYTELIRSGNYVEPTRSGFYSEPTRVEPYYYSYNTGTREGMYENKGGYVDTRARYHPYSR